MSNNNVTSFNEVGDNTVTSFNEAQPTDYDTPHVVIVGAPFEIQRIFGPFNSFEDASEWADRCYEFTWIATLTTPDTPHAA